jgi:phosphoribosylamine-glycine ligase
MSNSINTNVGAMVALASLRTAQSALNTASKQVQTGYRVADSADDASSFSVAQGIRANLQAYTAVKEIRWAGAWCRKDIGDKGLRRERELLAAEAASEEPAAS